jgi:hypothetical protein
MKNASGTDAIKMARRVMDPFAQAAKVSHSPSNAKANAPDTQPAPVDHRSGLEKMLASARSKDYSDSARQATKIADAIRNSGSKSGGDGRGGVSHKPPGDL